MSATTLPNVDQTR